jgi:hypothetical protein
MTAFRARIIDMNNATRARKYREQAAQIRIIAEDVRGSEWRRFLLKVAKDYERMALDFEAAKNGAPRRRRGLS